MTKPDYQPTDAPLTIIGKVLQVFLSQERNGATIDEIAASLNMPANSISSRVAVLHRRGLICEHPGRFTRKTRTGSNAMVWMSCSFIEDSERHRLLQESLEPGNRVMVPDPAPKPPPAEELPPTPDSYGLRFHRIAAIATRLLEDGLTSPKAEKRVRRILTIATNGAS